MRTAPYILLLAWLAASQPAYAEPLGRLFLTPEERHPHPAIADAASQAAPTINGIIRNSRGSGMIWINGQAQVLTGKVKSSRDVSETPPDAANLPPEPTQ